MSSLIDFGDKRVEITADGSSTIYLPVIDEHYHSSNGAMAESMHVFINMGLRKAADSGSEINILEVGFGTGLNALLTFAVAGKVGLRIDYTALEPYPISSELVSSLNFLDFPDLNDFHDQFYSMHESVGPIQITPEFRFLKCASAIQSFESAEKFQLVYFDAFAPQKQPEMWTLEIFQKIHSMMVTDGILVTYSAKGDVRRALKAAGFKIERLPGAPGKREMLRAIR